jgi:hypothetical protein
MSRERVRRSVRPASAIPVPPVRRCACTETSGASTGCERCRARESDRHEHAGLASVGDVLRTEGQPLGAAMRGEMEARYGHDFSHVRIHADSRATESAVALGALAYTVGRDVVMARGHYPPTTPADRRLLAHELMHVVQAATSGARAPHGQTMLTPARATSEMVSRPDDPSEREAERLADGAPRSFVERATARDARVIRRQPEPRPPTKREEETEARLRRLAARPGDALAAWRTLQGHEQTFVVLVMSGRYGGDFAREFQEYAAGRKKPNISATISNSPSDTPENLVARGYRRFGDPGGITVWVHPSGHEIHILTTQKKPGPPEPGPDDDPEKLRARCIDPCLLDTEDEDECHACCDALPQDDRKCVRACHAACEHKL